MQIRVERVILFQNAQFSNQSPGILDTCPLWESRCASNAFGQQLMCYGNKNILQIYKFDYIFNIFWYNWLIIPEGSIIKSFNLFVNYLLSFHRLNIHMFCHWIIITQKNVGYAWVMTLKCVIKGIYNNRNVKFCTYRNSFWMVKSFNCYLHKTYFKTHQYEKHNLKLRPKQVIGNVCQTADSAPKCLKKS